MEGLPHLQEGVMAVGQVGGDMVQLVREDVQDRLGVAGQNQRYMCLSKHDEQCQGCLYSFIGGERGEEDMVVCAIM